MCNIGNRHADKPSAIGIRFGMDRVIKVTGISTVNGNKGTVAKIGPSAKIGNRHAIRFGCRGIREDVRNVEFGKGERAEGAGCVCRTKIVDHPGSLADIAAPWQQFRLDKLAFPGRHITIALKHDGIASTTVRLLQDQATPAGGNGAEQPAWC